GKEREHALVAKLLETLLVSWPTHHRSGIELEVAGIDDGSHRCVQRDGAGIRDRVCDVDVLSLEVAELHLVATGHFMELDLVVQTGFLQLTLNKADGQRR